MRPYDESRLPSYEWIYANVPAVEMDPWKLLPSQPDLDIHRLLALALGGLHEGPDECAHVVDHDGRYYVHNGHHRWMLALLRGEILKVRPVTETPQPREDERPLYHESVGAGTEMVEREPECVANWPDCWNGGYHPSCCRFPKVCSVQFVPCDPETP